jgi:hypothetical protein
LSLTVYTYSSCQTRSLGIHITEDAKVSKLVVPEFSSYKEEATWWDNLDHSLYMDPDDEWFTFTTPLAPAVSVAVLPEIAASLRGRARRQGVSLETLVNVLLQPYAQAWEELLTEVDRGMDEQEKVSQPQEEQSLQEKVAA